MGQLNGKTALVTGSSSGIGRAIAKRYADEGARVYLTGRREAELEAATKEAGADAVAIRCDVSKAADLDHVFDVIRQDGRGLDVVVANAGMGELARLEDATEEEFARIFDTNLKGSLLTVQKALPLLTPGAAVILLSSSSTVQGNEGMGLYAASKAAVRSLGRTWAAELASRGVRVNVLTPGPISTPGIDGLAADLGQDPERFRDALASQVPLGRIGRPEEVAAMAAFLASEENSFATGAEFFVDGGQVQV